MAIKELFYDNRPQVLLNPRASQRIDPRFKFTRNTTGTFVDKNGFVQIAEANQPRIDHDPATGEFKGLLVEESRANLVPYSNKPTLLSNTGGFGTLIPAASVTTLTPAGSQSAWRLTVPSSWSQTPRRLISFPVVNATVTYSCFMKGITNDAIVSFGPFNGSSLIRVNLSTGSIEFTQGSGHKVQYYGNGWWRVFTSGFFNSSGGLGGNFGWDSTTANAQFYIWGVQIEAGIYGTSYIQTGGSAVTRAADLLSVEAPLPASGSVYIDARAISANENDTLLSLKNSSNDKIDLSYISNTSTYNSLALIANYNGNSKTSLPLPVPSTDRERNIITWGANNYQYTRDSSRFAASLSSSVPTGLNQLSIGHDAVDPTKALNGYINTVYAWFGELTPAVAEALVRNEIEAINADTYSPVGPAGSLALVINTQGTSTSGNKTFTLPAESAANDNDIVITWGDGTESGLDGSDAELGASGLTHTYSAAGIYPVWVEGQMEGIRFNNIANAKDVLQIAAWGTGDMFTAPSTMNSAFYGCTQMDFSSSARTTNRPDTSAVTNWYRAFRDCSSITGTFPAFNFSAATTFQEAWRGCSSMTAFVAAGDQTQNVTNFASAWYNCNSLTAFPQINTSSGTNFSSAWYNCSSLTSFPLINTAAGANFGSAWSGCSSLTSFPLINTAAGTSFSSAWFGCSSLTSFPLIDTSSGTSFSATWRDCSNLTSFPLINTAAGTNFSATWRSCSNLTNFPLINTAAGTNFSATWRDCSGLTSFPLINTAAGTNFSSTWTGCSSLTSFPLINTAAGTSFSRTWNGCSSLTSFPLINTAAGTNFSAAWYNNNGLTAFPALDFDSATGLASDASDTYTGFRETWRSCDTLADFPANRFDNTTCTRYLDAFRDCALTATSIENILVSINAAGTSNGNLSLQGGTNAGASTWTAAAVTAYDDLVARGWTITRNA